VRHGGKSVAAVFPASIHRSDAKGYVVRVRGRTESFRQACNSSSHHLTRDKSLERRVTKFVTGRASPFRHDN
jgi:hypothetical protein